MIPLVTKLYFSSKNVSPTRLYYGETRIQAVMFSSLLSQQPHFVVFYRPQRSWGKVIFSEACQEFCSGGYLGRYTPRAGTLPGQVHRPGQVLPPGQVHPPAGTPPPGQILPPNSAQCMLGDMGNKRAVRILLECNLVLIVFR